jgi:hypothetical protein
MSCSLFDYYYIILLFPSHSRFYLSLFLFSLFGVSTLVSLWAF